MEYFFIRVETATFNRRLKETSLPKRKIHSFYPTADSLDEWALSTEAVGVEKVGKFGGRKDGRQEVGSWKFWGLEVWTYEKKVDRITD